MNTLSQDEMARANKSHTRLLQALGETQQNTVALAIGCEKIKKTGGTIIALKNPSVN